MSFIVLYSSNSERFLKKQEKAISHRIIDKVEATLVPNPVPSDAKCIVGQHGVFRLRVGDFRILYRINYEEKKIIIVDIDKRERIY